MLRQKPNSTTEGYRHYSHSNGTQSTLDYNQHQSNYDKQSINRDGCHYNSHHRHHGKSNDYHHGSSGDTRRMQCGRSNNRHRTGMIANSITHESGKFLNYHQMNGQHKCASSTSQSKDLTNKSKDVQAAHKKANAMILARPGRKKSNNFWLSLWTLRNLSKHWRIRKHSFTWHVMQF